VYPLVVVLGATGALLGQAGQAVVKDGTQLALAALYTMGFATPRPFVRAWEAEEFLRLVEATGPGNIPAEEKGAKRVYAAALAERLDGVTVRFAAMRPPARPGLLAAPVPGFPEHLVAESPRPRLFEQDDARLVTLGAQHAARVLQESRRLEQEEASRRLAEELAAFKSHFLRHIGHELANPLSPIKLQLTALKRKHPELADAFLPLERNAKRIETLIKDISAVARVTDPTLPMDLKPVDLVALARSVASAFAATAAAARCDLTLEGPPELVVVADASRLNQVFDNLVSNAIKYSPSGGHITIEIAPQGEGAEVAITDQGLGFTQEQAARLFKTYSRVHREIAPAIPGSGLGLYLVNEVVGQHHGHATANSPGPDQGATFTFWLPRVPSADAVSCSS
jgi:signal transduction histidine kinase